MFRSLEDIQENDKDRAGIKAYHCSLLLKLRVNAPKGFVIMNTMTVQDRKAIFKFVSKEKLYAVRSSMGDEDKSSSSNAGKYLSVMAVTGENVIDEIRRVLRTAKRVTSKCVLVQELILSEASGVLFTRNPVYHSNGMLINACLGAGENVVSGRGEVDSYEVTQEKVVKTIEPKKVVFTYGFDSWPGEHRYLNEIKVRTVISNEFKTIHSVYGEYENSSVLTDKQIRELYQTACYLKKIFNMELDMEFAYMNQKLYILQVRSITKVLKIEKTEYNVEIKEGILYGQIVSAGLFAGQVVRIDLFNKKKLNIAVLGKEEKIVLVIYELIPEIIFRIKNIGAIITAKGGVLSHGAILARERNIPCITNLGDAIYSLHDGMQVKVDANRGEIVIENTR